MTQVCAVAVIGHVDHGKTSLVRSLTGIETDRLKEERERGLSMTLGFAFRAYPSATIDFIDTPGHEDFIRAMVAGATGVRAALLVVSAVEGFARQTVEHLEIVKLLGVRSGVVAITKSDLLPDEQRIERLREIKASLAGTALADQPMVFCSSMTGDGLDRLNHELSDLSKRTPGPPKLPGFFLPVDRVFNFQGIGAIATGTLLGGPLAVGAAAQVAPQGRSAVVRRIQARGVECHSIEPGGRTAVNLRGIALDDVRPGDVVCAPTVFASSDQLDVEITTSRSMERPFKHMEEVRVLLGTRISTATARLLGAKRLEPGNAGYARLHFASPVVAFAGQRGVLRRLSPSVTIGGLVVLDPNPPASKAPSRISILEATKTGDAVRIGAALAERDRGVINLSEAARLTRCNPEDVSTKLDTEFDRLTLGTAASREAIHRATKAYREALAQIQSQSRTRSAVPLGVVRDATANQVAQALVGFAERALVESGEIVILGGQVKSADHDPLASLDENQRLQLSAIEERLRDGGTKPPDLVDLAALSREAPHLVTLLVEAGRVVRLENHALRQTIVFHTEALSLAFESLRDAFPSPAAFRTGEAREVLGTSRKFIVPILEHFDARGLTVRDGDARRVSFMPTVVGEI